MSTKYRLSTLAIFSALGLLLAGCGNGNEEVRIYKISYPENQNVETSQEGSARPAPDRAPTPTPPMVNASPESSGAPSVNPSSSMTVLPGMESQAAAIDTPEWSVPDGWEVLAPTSIRKGNFRITEEGKVAEVTVTAFPGDVGGLEANVNRWRRQISLPPVTGEALENSIQPIEVDGQEAFYIDLLKEDAPDAPSILGAVIPRGSKTWFVKMIGDTSILAEQPESFKAFLDSIRF